MTCAKAVSEAITRQRAQYAPAGSGPRFTIVSSLTHPVSARIVQAIDYFIDRAIAPGSHYDGRSGLREFPREAAGISGTRSGAESDARGEFRDGFGALSSAGAACGGIENDGDLFHAYRFP